MSSEKEYSVGLKLIVKSDTKESEILKFLGIVNEYLEKVELNEGGFLWSVDSGIEQSGSLDEHLSALSLKLGKNLKAVQIKPVFLEKIYLSVGVFYKTYTCTTLLPPESLVKLYSLFPYMEVEICSYPTSDEEG